MSEAGYTDLFRSGELEQRAARLEARLAACDLCPRECGVDRRGGRRSRDAAAGFCGAGWLPAVATVCRHTGEEPVISGSRGSGTVFFAGCNLRCVYCQNHQISQGRAGARRHEMGFRELAEQMVRLQDSLGCHNINLVSPSHFVPQIMRALLEAVPLGLRAPLVFNTSGYDSVRTLAELEGVVAIYLTDLRYASDSSAWRLSRAKGYVGHARAAIMEMHRQVGELVVTPDGVARSGLIVRHLVLPNRLAGTVDSLAWLAREVSPAVTVSVMSQYYPAHRAAQFPHISRGISESEYDEVVGALESLGMENGWVQEMGSARSHRPDFNREGHPFSPTTA